MSDEPDRSDRPPNIDLPNEGALQDDEDRGREIAGVTSSDAERPGGRGTDFIARHAAGLDGDAGIDIDDVRDDGVARSAG